VDLPSLTAVALMVLAVATLVWMRSVSRSPRLAIRAKVVRSLVGWLIVSLCGAGVWAVAQGQIAR
jgi:hypothetical protein